MSLDNKLAYDKIASDFASDRNKAPVPVLIEEFADLLQKGDHILDVGCGTGLPITKYLKDKDLVITGIDISSKLLEQARTNVPEGRFIKADVMEFEPLFV